MFPGYRVRAVSNGVHASTWASPSFRRLFDAFLPAWRHEPEVLVRADCCIPDDDLWRARRDAKQPEVDSRRLIPAFESDDQTDFVRSGFAEVEVVAPADMALERHRLHGADGDRPWPSITKAKRDSNVRDATVRASRLT